MIRYVYILLLIQLAGSRQGAHAQWTEVSREEYLQVVDQMNAATKNHSSMVFQTRHDFYEQPDQKTPVLTYQGEIAYGPDGLVNIRQFNQLVVQGKTFHVTVDTQQRQIVVAPIDSLKYTRQLELHRELFVAGTCRVFRLQEGANRKYQILFPEGVTYSSLEIWINAQNEMTRYILIAGQEVVDDSGVEDKLIRPKLDIAFQQFRYGKQNNTFAWVKEEDLVVLVDGKLKPAARYQQFELIDLRIKQ